MALAEFELQYLLNIDCIHKYFATNPSEQECVNILTNFLHYALREMNNLAEGLSPPVPVNDLFIDCEGTRVTNKRIRAFLTLSLKIAAFLKWDPSIFQRFQPSLSMLLIRELLFCAFGDLGLRLDHHPLLDPTKLDDSELFVSIFFHSWCIQTFISNSLPKPPVYESTITVPGLKNIDTPLPDQNLAVQKFLTTFVTGSAELLARCLKFARDTRVPGFLNFPSDMDLASQIKIEEDAPTTKPGSFWVLSRDQIALNISWLLGEYFFLKKDFPKASAYFDSCEVLHKIETLNSPVRFTTGKLTGYVAACNSLVGKYSDESFFGKVEATLKSPDCQGLLDLLTEDNQAPCLPSGYRRSIVSRLPATNRTLRSAVLALNEVRFLFGDQVFYYPNTHFLAQLGEEEDHQMIGHLFKSIENLLPKATPEQKRQVHRFILQFRLYFTPEFDLRQPISKFSSCVALFSVPEIEQLGPVSVDHVSEGRLHHQDSDLPLEKQLILAFEPNHVRSLVEQLYPSMTRMQITCLSERWRVPSKIQPYMEALRTPMLPEFSFIAVAKAKHCITIKRFVQARALLQAADLAIKDLSYDLSKFLRWEILLCDLLEFEESDSTTYSSDSLNDLTRRVKTCVSSFQKKGAGDGMPQPTNEVVNHCSIYLLNTELEWSYLRNLQDLVSPMIFLVRSVVDLCQNVQHRFELAKASSLPFMESVIQILSSSAASKRSMQLTIVGAVSMGNFLLLVRKVSHPTAVTVLISCLTRLLLILKSISVEQVHFEYQDLWLSAVNTSAIHASDKDLNEVLNALLDNALSLDPANTSWLRTAGDIAMADQNFFVSVRRYLSLINSETKYFRSNLDRLTNHLVIPMLIKALSRLEYHTQAAVLCQFCEPVDYGTAFRELQESNTLDARDLYYDFIFDMSILEFLVHYHDKRLEIEKRDKVTAIIGVPELNESNPEPILVTARNKRKAGFLRALFTQFCDMAT